MDKNVPIGTEVLIFRYNPSLGPNQDEERFIRGRIESSEIIGETTMHGSTWDIRYYKVLGEDNKTYYGTYNTGLRGHHYFRSIEDHINHVRNKMISNNQEIIKLNEENIKLFDLITDLSKIVYEKNESELSPEEYLRERESILRFKSLDEMVTTLADLNVKRYRRNNLIKKEAKKSNSPRFQILAVPSNEPIVITKEQAQKILNKK